MSPGERRLCATLVALSAFLCDGVKAGAARVDIDDLFAFGFGLRVIDVLDKAGAAGERQGRDQGEQDTSHGEPL